MACNSARLEEKEGRQSLQPVRSLSVPGRNDYTAERELSNLPPNFHENAPTPRGTFKTQTGTGRRAGLKRKGTRITRS